MPAKRGERVVPPVKPGNWDVRYANSGAVKGWEELARTAPANTWEAWVILAEQPVTPVNPARQHRLKAEFATAVVQGRTLEQWQYEVTAGGRVWYCPDAERRIVWVTHAGTGHPRATD